MNDNVNKNSSMVVSDYIVKYLEEYGIKHIFTVVGGGAMFLNNSFGKSKKIKNIFMHHEQSCSFASEGYSRVNNYKLSVVNVTSGPGGTNTITGVLGQWTDSIPVLYLSGQVKYKTTTKSSGNPRLRQLGDQEINILDIVSPITKYAKMITDPYSITRELDKAISIATTGRPGPVWLDLPLDIQGTLINEDELQECIISESEYSLYSNVAYSIIELLKSSKRPLFIVGHGIRIGKAQEKLLQLIEQLNIPVVTTFNGFDLIPSDHFNFVGRIGTVGTRSGNFALQNADLVFCLGTRNNIRQISYDWKSFAKKAKKIIVDIDIEELYKSTVEGDILICGNVKDFIENCLHKIPINYKCDELWLQWCKERKDKYPVVLEEYKNQLPINPYYFIKKLTEKLNGNEIVVAGNGTACVSLFQAGIVKKNQRIFWNSGCAAMGYDLPAAIGAAIASKKEVICLVGDGSIMMNLQELQTIKNLNFPIKIFILNNKGYHSIIQTQNNCFQGELVGCNEQSGLSFPNFLKLAKTFELKYFKMNSTQDIDIQFKDVLSYNGPVICEVMLDTNYIFQPKLSSEKLSDGTMISKPLEDMYPFLSKEELQSNMIGENSEF